MATLFKLLMFMWSSYGAGIPQMLEASPATGLHFPKIASLGLSSRTPTLSHCAKSRLLSMALHAFRTYTIGVTLTLPSSIDSTRDNLGHPWNTASVCWFSGNTSQKILPQWCQILLNHHHFLSSRQLSIPAKQRFHCSSSGILLTPGHSSVPDD